MIAELHGKINNIDTKLEDRLEYNFISNLLGPLRYMSFNNGMKKILSAVINEKKLETDEAWADTAKFWPYHKDGKLDLVIKLYKVTIGIKIKYSNDIISNEDMVDQQNVDFKNEVIDATKALNDICGNTEPILILITDKTVGKEIMKQVNNAKANDNKVSTQFISLEKICSILQQESKNTDLNEFEKVIITDMYNLLSKLGFNRFEDFTTNIDSNISINNEYFLFS